MFWQPVIEKIQHKPHDGKYYFISKGGRHTLIQATLSSTTYYVSLFKLPTSSQSLWINWFVIFFWEGDNTAP